MRTETFLRIADGIRLRFDCTSDPEALCREAGIILLYSPMGSSPSDCKGFILSAAGQTAITVSSDLSRDLRTLILWHELSHYFLHIEGGTGAAFQDFSVSDMSSIPEAEANQLAAELMIPDDRIMELLEEGTDFFDMASALRVPPEMLEFKLRLLRLRRPDIPDAPIRSAGGFLAALADSPYAGC